MKETSLARTTTTLLQALRDPRQETAWREFDGRYRPVLESVGRHMGLSHPDAEEVAQETLVQFVRDYQRGLYQRDKGRLRVWIQGILRHRALDVLRRRSQAQDARGDSVLR